MAFKSAILLAGCISATTATAAAATTTERKPSQSRFLRNNRKRHDTRRGAAINQRLQNNGKAATMSSSTRQQEMDITAEDVSFWTRSLQSSIEPLPTKQPTTASSTFPTSIVTIDPTDPISTPVPTPGVATTPSPTPDAVTTPSPTPGAVTTPGPTDEPPGTPSPTIDPSESTPFPTPLPSVQIPTPFPSIEIVPTPAPTTNQPTLLPTASPTFPCNLSPEDRTSQIRKLLSSISDPDLFEDPSTPQAQALDWITNDDPIEPILCPNQFASGCTRGGNVNPIVQRYVLAAFYFATQGTEGWRQCTAPTDFDDEDAIAAANAVCDRVVTPYGVGNERVGDTSTDAWLGPSNECEWGGVACWGADTPNLNLCIDQLDFEDDGLSGELITEISVLNSLRFLVLEQGTISGPIPAQYGELNRLLILDMDFNNISGDIPEEIYGLDSLEVLDLNYNDITGSISSSIGDLELLIFLQIDHNSLSGAIPSEIGLLKNLRFAFLSDNDLTGVMPTEVCELRNNTSPPGVLGVLVTDCAGNPPEVVCPCCSSCA
mmetsp:Transcript_23661/g.40407  ORF Transcript_23661/g.40407 Transcript_23661/m.40407 type:complete len:545 (+) Transcript_23661:54-1688(+)